MNIIVTGATGFIGIGIINKLLGNQNNKIWAIIRPNSVNKAKVPAHPNIHTIELEIQDIQLLVGSINEQIDVFYHLAWEGIRGSYRNDFHLQNSNYLCTLNAFDVCRKLGCKKFICSGSQAEYGNLKGKISEEISCKPNTEYGKAKYLACCKISTLAKIHNIVFIWGRIFSVYGSEDYKNSLIMTCIKKMEKNESIALTECQQEWDYLYIDELAEIFDAFATSNCKSGVYNVASGNHKKLKYFVESIRSVMQSDSIINYGKIPLSKQEMVNFIPVITKMQKEISWESNLAFEDGIKMILQKKT